MRNKLSKYTNEDMNLYINYLENFRIGNYFFENE